jgi:hypothetical protein
MSSVGFPPHFVYACNSLSTMHEPLRVNLEIELRGETRLSNSEFKTVDVPP